MRETSWQAFVAAVMEVWFESGAEVLAQVRENNPDDYAEFLATVAELVPAGTDVGALSDEVLVAVIAASHERRKN